MSKRKLPDFIYTTRLLISTIKLDITDEIVLIAKYYDVEAGSFKPFQMICEPQVFPTLVDLIAVKYPELFKTITDIIPRLTKEPFVLELDEQPGSAVILDGGIFGLNRIEFFDRTQNKFVDTLSAWVVRYDEENDDDGDLMEDAPDRSIPTKLDRTRSTVALFDFVPCELKFNPRQQWAKEIGGNHKFLDFVNQVAYLQVKFRFYLHLRSKGDKIGAARQIACLRHPPLFTLARTIYAISANPNNFTPDQPRPRRKPRSQN